MGDPRIYGIKIMTISCDDKLHKAIKKRAAEEGLNVSAYMRDLVGRDIALYGKAKQ